MDKRKFAVGVAANLAGYIVGRVVMRTIIKKLGK